MAGQQSCLVLRPSKEEFSQPFCRYIKKALKKHPDVAMFKVVPPDGWYPRRRAFPKLDQVEIATPIKQHVFGTRGAYRCLLVEQRTMNAADFAHISDSHKPPTSHRTNRGETSQPTRRRTTPLAIQAATAANDELLERSFWSSITISPPLYGADTPQSFFDDKLPFGWNLRHLEGCLLKEKGVPHISGVTCPMTYFGMWKSFFSWHVEDADLYSINYLHFGAPKIWYCVPPSQRAKFERMAASLFPELHRACPAFMRHKDVMLSPSLLRTYGVEFVQAKQEANEFIVLNAGAYHAGYNTGFNCAEAVNFATSDWVEYAKKLVRCKCSVLNDGVRISMRLFGLTDSDTGSEVATDSEEEEEEEGDSRDAGVSSSQDRSACSEPSTTRDESGSEATSRATSDDDSEDESSREDGTVRLRRKAHAASGVKRRAASSAEGRRSAKPPPAKRMAVAARASAPARRASAPAKAASKALPPFRPAGRATKTSLAAAESARRVRCTSASAEARARRAAKAGASGAKRQHMTAEDKVASLALAAVAAAAIRQRNQAAAAQAPANGACEAEEEQAGAGAGGPRRKARAVAAAHALPAKRLQATGAAGSQPAQERMQPAEAEVIVIEDSVGDDSVGDASDDSSEEAGAVVPCEPQHPPATPADAAPGAVGRTTHAVSSLSAAALAASGSGASLLKLAAGALWPLAGAMASSVTPALAPACAAPTPAAPLGGRLLGSIPGLKEAVGGLAQSAAQTQH